MRWFYIYSAIALGCFAHAIATKTNEGVWAGMIAMTWARIERLEHK